MISGSIGPTRQWEAATGKLIRVLPFDAPVVAVAFSPDGKTVLNGSLDQTARFWDAATGQPIGTPMRNQGAVSAVAFNPNGKAVLTGSNDGRAQLWHSPTGRRVGEALRHRAAVIAVAFSPDGKTLLTGCNDSSARFWEGSTGRPIGVLKHQDAVSALAFSPNGKTVLTGSADQTARLWPVANLPDDLERVANWVEALTGLTLDDSGSVQVLDNTTWLRRREKVEHEGGSPVTGLESPPVSVSFGRQLAR